MKKPFAIGLARRIAPLLDDDIREVQGIFYPYTV